MSALRKIKAKLLAHLGLILAQQCFRNVLRKDGQNTKAYPVPCTTLLWVR